MTADLKSLKEVDYDQHKHTLRYKFSLIRTLPDLQKMMGTLIGRRAGVFKPSLSRRFATFGSCFAVNIGAALERAGAQVYVTRVTEDVNSTFNNRVVLRRVFLNEPSPFADAVAESAGVDYSEMRTELQKATDIVLTLGNIFHLEGAGSHVAKPARGTTLVRETYEQTHTALREIVALIKEHTNANLFVSVSPIPISGYIGTEFPTVVEADCASKCQLLVAVRSLSGFTYIPTFEIFRWLPAHTEFSTFGENARHIRGEHIDAVMEVLCGSM